MTEGFDIGTCSHSGKTRLLLLSFVPPKCRKCGARVVVPRRYEIPFSFAFQLTGFVGFIYLWDATNGLPLGAMIAALLVCAVLFFSFVPLAEISEERAKERRDLVIAAGMILVGLPLSVYIGVQLF